VDIKELQSYLNPPLLAIHSAFHQQAADELGRNLLGGAGEEGVGEALELLGGCGGYYLQNLAKKSCRYRAKPQIFTALRYLHRLHSKRGNDSNISAVRGNMRSSTAVNRAAIGDPTVILDYLYLALTASKLFIHTGIKVIGYDLSITLPENPSPNLSAAGH